MTVKILTLNLTFIQHLTFLWRWLGHVKDMDSPVLYTIMCVIQFWGQRIQIL